jgi:hypothetical protein
LEGVLTGSGRVPRWLRADRFGRYEKQLQVLSAEKKRLTDELDVEKATNASLKEKLRRTSLELNSWKEKARGRGAAKVKDDMELALARADLCSAVKARDDARAVSDDLRQQVDALARTGDLRRLLRDSQNASLQWEKTATRMREENLAAAVARRRLEESNTALTLESERVKLENASLLDEVTNLRASIVMRENRCKGEEGVQRRYPFLSAHMDFLLEKCSAPVGRKLPYPHKRAGGGEEVDWHDAYVLMSEGGEYLWQYLRSLFGFPSWRTVPRWRVVKLAELNSGRGMFDGTAANTATVVRLCKEKLGKLWLADAGQEKRAHSSSLVGAVACDAVAAMADVAVTLDGTVSGLKEPMAIAPELAVSLTRDPGAWASF